MYAIIDIETTGGNFRNEKITDIAIFIHDGEKVTDQYCTLINPGKDIPLYITNLTGITNEMVIKAPYFYEVAKRIIEITRGCIFVAHNVSFDYHFVQEEFRQLGFDFQMEKLCTLKLSRKFIPGESSYSLGNLCEQLHIVNHERHRAEGDARATVVLFEHLIGKGCLNTTNSKKSKPMGPQSQTEKSYMDELPHATGVYHLINDNGQIIYIGKSKDICNRVKVHFKDVSSEKGMKMKSAIADVGYEITGSELVALLLESFLIEKHKPLFNRMQRRTNERYGIYNYIDVAGFQRFWIAKNSGSSEIPLVSFDTISNAKEYLLRQIEKFELCQKLSGLSDSKGSCFHYQIKGCRGACIGEETPVNYNIRAEQFKNCRIAGVLNCWILDTGRNNDEWAIIRIRNGKYIGFGFLSKDITVNDPEMLDDCIKNYPDNKDVQHILLNYLENHPKLRKVYPVNESV